MILLTKLSQAVVTVTAWKLANAIVDGVSDEAKRWASYQPPINKTKQTKQLDNRDVYHILVCRNCKHIDRSKLPPRSTHCHKCGCVENVEYHVVGAKFYDTMNKVEYKKRY